MADFTGVTEGDCLRRKRPEGCVDNASHTFVLQSVINEIKAHGRTSLHEEVCGVLLGNLCFDGTPYLLIDGRIEGKYATHQSGSVTFTSETWDYINGERDAKFANRKIVGWYHTHPGFGIFLSNMDAFIHNNFFSMKWQPAYVFDPQAETDGFFFARGNSIEREDVVIVPDASPLVAESKTMTSPEKFVVLTEEEENRRAGHRFSTIILASVIFFILLVGVLCAFVAKGKLASSQKNAEEKVLIVQKLENANRQLEVENGKLMSEKQELSEKISEIMSQLGKKKEELRQASEYNVILVESNKALVAKWQFAITEGKRNHQELLEEQRKVADLGKELAEAQMRASEKASDARKYVEQISQIETHVRELEGEITALKQKLANASASAEFREEAEPEPPPKKSWYRFW